MIQHYLNVRLREYGRRGKTRPFMFLWDGLGVLISARLLYFLWLFKQGAVSLPFEVMRLSPGQILNGAILVMIALAQIGVDIVGPPMIEPYVRFWTFRTWFCRWITYSALNLRVILLAAILTISLGWYGLIVAAVCYGISLAASRWPLVHAMSCAVALALIGLSLPPVMVVSIWIGLIASILLWAFHARRILVPSVDSTMRELGGSVALSKEVACITYFKSDQVYLGLNSLAAVALLALVLTGSGSHDALHRLARGLPLFCVLPYSRIAFNLFGTESTAMQLYSSDANATALYAWRRLRMYSWISYSLGGLIFARLAMVNSWLTAVTFGAGLVLTVELVLPCAATMSAAMPEAKTVLYSQWANMRAASPKLAALVFLAIAGIVATVQYATGLVGLIVVASLALVFNARITVPIVEHAIIRRFPRALYAR